MNGTARERCTQAIRRVGDKAQLLRKEERLSFWASVQPAKSLADTDDSPLGRGPARRAVLYACNDENGKQVCSGDSLTWQGKRYYVLDIQTVRACGEDAYRRGILLEESGGEEGETG